VVFITLFDSLLSLIFACFKPKSKYRPNVVCRSIEWPQIWLYWGTETFQLPAQGVSSRNYLSNVLMQK